MEKYHIDLTDEEQALVERIQLSVPRFADVQKIYEANEQSVVALSRSLFGRGAIPEQRLKYCNDSEYNTGGRKRVSRKDAFERNGTEGDEMYAHLHFLPHLRYFLFGAELPDELIEMFEHGLEEKHILPEWFTSGDYSPTWKLARIAIREYGLERNKVADEFYKLCLDVGLGPYAAQTTRRDVKRIKA